MLRKKSPRGVLAGMQFAVWALFAGLAAVPTPLRLTAEAEDAYALRVNPAGLAFVSGSELRALYTRCESCDLHGLALYGALALGEGFTLGASYGGDFGKGGGTRTEGSFGLGFGSKNLALGLAYEYVGQFEGDGKGLISAGLSARGRYLAFGLGIRDLTQHVERRRWDIGLALRPIDRFLVSARWRLIQSQPLNSDTLDLTFFGGIEPIDGLHLSGGADLDGNLYAQLEVATDNLAFGAAGQVPKDQDPNFITEMVFRGTPRPGFLSMQRGIAILDLSGGLVADPRFDLFGGRFTRQPYGPILFLLQGLTRSERVDGLYLRIGRLELGWGRLSELRRSLAAFIATGRRIDCQLGVADVKTYWLASVCTSVILPPPGSIEARGVGTTSLYLGEALSQLGVEVEVARRGAYKNAPDAFTRAGMSPEEQEAMLAYEDAIYTQLIDGVASGRKLERAEVERLYTQGTMTASVALGQKLVDAVLYPDQIEDYLRRELGPQLRFVDPKSALMPRRPTWRSLKRVAIIHVDSAISGGDSQDLPFGLGTTSGAGTLIGALDAARQDPSVAAVILRVDSPGGDAYASDLVARAVELTNAEKPVIASFGDVAASGGYYVAAPARWILAEPTTLTGSIGVFSLKLTVEQLLSKLGIGVGATERGEKANLDSPLRKDPATQPALEAQVESVYRDFLRVVAKGRKMSEADVQKLAEGRIWSGADAQKNGLVDELGGLIQALAKAKAEAGLDPQEEVELVHLPERGVGVPELLRNATEVLVEPAAPPASSLPPAWRRLAATLVTIAQLSGPGQVLALSPVLLDLGP